MTIAPIVADIVQAAMKPLRGGRQKALRCAYCGIVLGEAVWMKDDYEYERYITTDDGEVCDECAADPTAKERWRQVAREDARRRVYRRGLPVTPDGKWNRKRREDPVKAMRNIDIWRMAQRGMLYADIAAIVGLTRSGVGFVVRRMREKSEGQT